LSVASGLDTRYHALEGLRSGSLLLQPAREFMRAPADVAAELSGFFTRHRLLQKERDALLAERAQLAVSLNVANELARENTELRTLMQLQARPGQQTVHAALLYQGHNWFAQRITLDQGARSGSAQRSAGGRCQRAGGAGEPGVSGIERGHAGEQP
jgi:rod shape-determining protein MreC